MPAPAAAHIFPSLFGISGYGRSCNSLSFAKAPSADTWGRRKESSALCKL